MVRDAQVRGDFRKDADIEALLSLLLLIFPHLALAPYMRGLDPILGLDEPTPEQPALAVRRLVAVLAAAFSANTLDDKRIQPQKIRGGHMTRTKSHSMVAGGLNWDSLPLKLFAGGNAKFWNPADIDFSRDRADWERLTDDERHYATRLCAEFIAGEEAVTEDIQPFMAAMRAEGRLGDEMYLTQFAFEEAKHTQVFRMWLDAVGITDDLHEYLEDVPTYRTIFYEELPECAQRVIERPVTGGPDPGVGHLQPHGRRHAGADRVLRLAQDLRGARHPARDAGAGSAHR